MHETGVKNFSTEIKKIIRSNGGKVVIEYNLLAVFEQLNTLPITTAISDASCAKEMGPSKVSCTN